MKEKEIQVLKEERHCLGFFFFFFTYVRRAWVADTTCASKLQFFFCSGSCSSSQGGFSAHFAQCSYAPDINCNSSHRSHFSRVLQQESSCLHFPTYFYFFRALCSSLQLVFCLVRLFHGQFTYDQWFPSITREFSVIRTPSQDLVRAMRRPNERS